MWELGHKESYEVKVDQSYPTPCDPIEYTVHGILQARILERVALSFLRGSSQLRDWTQVSLLEGRFFTNWATREALVRKRAERQRIDTLELWCWRRLLRVPWTARRSNQSIIKEISPEYSLEGLRQKAEALILWPPDENWLIGKDPDAGKDWRQEEKGITEDDMVGWHHRLSGHVFEQAPGVGDYREAWHAAVHGVAKSRTRLSDWTELMLQNRANALWLTKKTRIK